MLDLDGHVVGQAGMAVVHLLHDRQRVGEGIEEVRVAEGDVLCSGGDLGGDVVEHDLALHDAKTAVVDGDHRAVTAPVPAAATGLRVPGHPAVPTCGDPRV